MTALLLDEYPSARVSTPAEQPCESARASCATLEDWILAGLKTGHSLPVLGGIDLNQVLPGDYRGAMVAVPADRLTLLVGIVSLGGDAVEDAVKYDQ